ncbi:MAG: hypothetical protein ACRD3J_02355 [Thermoanaerobaculia bacterium]
MLYKRIVLSAAACLFAAALSGAEPECTTNYHSDGKSSETFVVTVLSPKAVIERLPKPLFAEGVTMDTSQPEKGILNAEGLDVMAVASGEVTRVTFHSSVAANRDVLCRYAALVGNPPVPRKPLPPQDPALIAKLENDLIRWHQLVQLDKGAGLNSAMLASEEEFLKFEIEDIKQVGDNKLQYNLSMQLPRSVCKLATEDGPLVSDQFRGIETPPRTKPVQVDVTLIYTKTGNATRLSEAFITRIESTK